MGSQASQRSGGMSPRERTARILVADDERLMNDFLREILTRKGFIVFPDCGEDQPHHEGLFLVVS